MPRPVAAGSRDSLRSPRCHEQAASPLFRRLATAALTGSVALAMPTYSIAPCTVADGADISRNNISAFWEDPHWILAWRHTTLEHHIVEVAKRIPRNLLTDRTTKRHQKVTDPDTGRLLGYARWYLPPSHATSTDGAPVWPEAIVPAVEPKAEAEIRRIAATAIWDPNAESDALLVPIREVKNEILARKPYMHLEYLAVHPENQGKGVATVLVQSGMKEAEKVGLDIFIHAMKAGVGLYQRLGFRVAKEFVQDDSMYGGNGEHHVYLMIYEQNSSPNV
ncbi:acetyltransferase-2 [Coleophoma cylindrospora]|uniref:Acetyltransferase-2 n=1 Tax=Coleophoma cylindrospora TaxID=1849047 RepID=A0A3D8R7D1_9HELO|nr:acetyltransferase-2 [Coleophoma cylindrospora]